MSKRACVPSPPSEIAKKGKVCLEAPFPLEEHDVGIVSYTTSTAGFSGVLKHLYRDFIVREVSREKQIVRLTDLTSPKDPRPTGEATGSTREAGRDVLCSLLSPEDVTLLEGFLKDPSTSDSILLSPETNKQRRKQVHLAIKEHFPDLTTDSVPAKDGAHCVRIFRSSGSRREKEAKGFDVRDFGWPADRGPYLRFVLYKENRDTHEMITTLCRLARLPSKAFSTAGTKDKRAVTTQHVTGFKVHASRICGQNSKLGTARVGNFAYVDEELRPGDLFGNRFTIILREIAVDDTIIQEAVEAMKRSGFVNYFGMQRFGSTTHLIGRAALREEWAKVVDLLLSAPRNEENRKALELYAIGDYSGAFAAMPKRMYTERLVLEWLQEKPGDYCGAFHSIPRSLRTLYIHALQSLVWNKVVTRRIQQWGCAAPVVGDLVWDDWEESSVHLVSDEDVAASRFSIEDVVLPLPGWDVQFPKNDTQNFYTQVLEEEGLTMASFSASGSAQQNLPGHYRRMLMKPLDMEWSSLRYNDPNIPLTQTDLDVLSGVSPPSPISDGKFKALHLDFTLPSGTYATMLIREVLKTSTTKDRHRIQSLTCLRPPGEGTK